VRSALAAIRAVDARSMAGSSLSGRSHQRVLHFDAGWGAAVGTIARESLATYFSG
jgi:hypothetical protein